MDSIVVCREEPDFFTNQINFYAYGDFFDEAQLPETFYKIEKAAYEYGADPIQIEWECIEYFYTSELKHYRLMSRWNVPRDSGYVGRRDERIGLFR